MSEAKFTKGRWVAAQKHSSKVGLPVVASPHGRSIASVTFFGLGENFKSHDDESYANAHLIAAAPELYEALKDILGIIPPDYEESPMVAFAKAALTKARGEV